MKKNNKKADVNAFVNIAINQHLNLWEISSELISMECQLRESFEKNSELKKVDSKIQWNGFWQNLKNWLK
ncbi:hypothetical protein [Aquiflexum lacus]|uniref:hypothetical protein n=1 Tax=Aquiflexum lacus TaxID=2483805 RepID=UPI001895DAA4|nr:hypothetical protein [Aquiflexum lacus]